MILSAKAMIVISLWIAIQQSRRNQTGTSIPLISIFCCSPNIREKSQYFLNDCLIHHKILSNSDVYVYKFDNLAKR